METWVDDYFDEYSGTFYYVTNTQGDVIALIDKEGEQLVRYEYDAWGKPVLTYYYEYFGEYGYEDVYAYASYNPLRYRGYVYDTETGLYYLQSRYYDPEIGRFINADGQISGIGGEFLGYNQFAYCFNNPVNHSDSSGNWPKWLSGALNVVSGVMQAAAGAVIGATVGWTGIGAVAAAALIANGAATATQGVGQIYNAVTQTNTFREDNIIRTGFQEVGQAIGGDTGATVAGMVYDTGMMIAAAYASFAKAPPPSVQPTVATYNLNGSKDIDYISRRGWNDKMINNAISNGRTGTSINMANNAPCTAYLYPGTQNQYVVIENISRSVVQVSNFYDDGWFGDKGTVLLSPFS